MRERERDRERERERETVLGTMSIVVLYTRKIHICLPPFRTKLNMLATTSVSNTHTTSFTHYKFFEPTHHAWDDE